MKRILSSLLALGFSMGLSPAEVALTFDTTTEAFVPGNDGAGDPPKMEWSDFNGGSIALSFDTGWKPQTAKLDVRAHAELLAELESALVNGGTITYDLYVKTDDIIGTAPQWFEPMYIGNSDGVYDQSFAAVAGQPGLYGAGAFPAGATQHFPISYAVEAASSAVSDVRAQFKVNATYTEIFIGLNSGGAGFTSGKFYIDNFKIASNAIPEIIPPPTISLQPAKPGLTIVASGGNLYSRQNVRTTNPQYSWVGATEPVTYSFTISDYPAAAGFTSVLYLVPGSGIASNISDLDWNRPICLYARVSNNADGSAWMEVSYKNGTEGNNGITGHDYFTNDNPDDLHDGIDPPTAIAGTGKGGRIASLGSSRILGKWDLTFTSNTTFTLTAPDGGTSSGSLPNEATAQLFADPLYAYFGNVPGDDARKGLSSILSSIDITGVAVPVNGDPGALLTDTTLEKAASDPNGIVAVEAGDPSYWFSWTLPATDYVIQQSSSLGNDAVNNDLWTDVPTATPYTLNGNARTALLPGSSLVNPTRNFFRMSKP